MKKLLFIPLVLLITLSSCCRGVDNTETGGEGGTDTEPTVLPENTKLGIKLYYLDKSGQEIDSTFKDLNVILVNNSYAKTYHLFSSQEDFYSGKVANGNYDVFIVGNWGKKIGETSKDKLFELQYAINNSDAIDKDIMVAHDNFYLSKDSSFYYLIERLASQIKAKVSLADGVNGNVVSLQAKDCAGTIPLFPSTRTLEDEYYDAKVTPTNELDIPILGKMGKKLPYISVLAEIEGQAREYKVPIELTRAVDCNYQVVINKGDDKDFKARKSEAVFYSGMPKFAFGDYKHFNNLTWNARTAYMELNLTSAQVSNSFKVSFKKLRGTFARNSRMEYMEQGNTSYTKLNENEEIIINFKQGDDIAKIVTFAFSNDNTIENRPTNNLFIFTIKDNFGYQRNVLVRTSMSL